MNRPVILKQRKSGRGRSRVKGKTELLEAFPPQESFSGTVPVRFERPAAELLRERLEEADPAGNIQVFVP